MSTILRIGGALTLLSLGLQTVLPSEAIAMGNCSSTNTVHTLLITMAESEASRTDISRRSDLSQYTPPPDTGAPDGTEGSGTR